MPRKAKIVKREILPDSRYNDLLIAQLINKVMWDGKKSIAESIVYGALEKLSKGKEGTPAELFKTVINNIRPQVMVKSTRIGGATYQVPTEITFEKSVAIGMRWVIQYARKRSDKGMVEKLAGELEDGFHKRGNTFKKRDETHKMAEANKAFAHYKW